MELNKLEKEMVKLINGRHEDVFSSIFEESYSLAKGDSLVQALLQELAATLNTLEESGVIAKGIAKEIFLNNIKEYHEEIIK